MTAQAGGASPPSDAAIVARAQLRRRMRRLRRSLPDSIHQQAAKAVAARLLRLPLIAPGARIGIYLALPGELGLQPFIEAAWNRGCRLYVPHITHVRHRQMSFYPYHPASRLQTDRWGIPQLRDLQRPQRIDGMRLDVVLVPTVAFDRQGNRLGMGAGFYDRHFARLSRTPRRQRPHLIGIAFACQETGALDRQPHDVPLELIATERALIRTRHP